MPVDLANSLVVAISSRALFDLQASHHVYAEQGIEAYAAYQIEHEEQPLEPGIAFPLVKKLLALNESHGAVDAQEQPIEVVLLSRNSADTGLRIFNSIEHYGLNITRAAFTGGAAPYPYLQAYQAQLFLSANQQDVRSALEHGCAAASIVDKPGNRASSEGPLKIAFDGDAVLFSDEAERIYQQQGLSAFAQAEKAAANQPLPGGPFQGFLKALHGLQQQWPADASPIRTALVTARSAPAHERVIKTLRAWNIRIDEALFLGGMNKAEFLAIFGADIFFDDQRGHVESASTKVPSAHVPHGVANEA